MPFTFAHPAIILPLLKKHSKLFSATGLVVGSMAPDFESFIDYRKIYGHTWIGMFWFDLPLALLLATIFHAIVRAPLIENLPKPLEERFAEYRNVNWFAHLRSHFLLVIVSFLIGIFSHLLWDACTHLNFSNPHDTTSHIKVFGMRLYKILQYASSIIGMLVITWAVYSLPRKKITSLNNVKYQYWLILLLLTLLISVILITVVFTDIVISTLLLIYVGMFAGFTSLLLVSLIYRFLLRRQHD